MSVDPCKRLARLSIKGRNFSKCGKVAGIGWGGGGEGGSTPPLCTTVRDEFACLSKFN